jgi:O-antigen/teichoic acid export membrane protein|tara:strand:+ start:1056 stop:2486 length:1431 start_codon:yes stop_codon:yes gene_type:complete
MSIRKLGKQSLIYGLGHILARLVTFLLLPLYTNVFSAREYGVVALFYTFLSFLNVIMRYGLGAAFLKFYVPAEKEERKAVFSNVIVSLFVTGIPFFLICHGLGHFLSPIILGVDEPSYVTIMGLIIVLDTIWSIPLLGFRAENRPGLFITFSLLNVGITIGLNLFLILKMGMGIDAIFLSNLSASAFIFLLSLPYIYHRFEFTLVSRKRWDTIIKFAIPFLPAGLFSMAMEVADRYILNFLTDLATVGIYNAGYKVGMLMMLSVTAFNFGWQPFFLEKGKDSNQGNLFGKVTTFALAALGFIWLLLMLWADDLIQLEIMGYSFFGPEFQKALPIIPWIALGYLFYGFYVLQTPGIFLKDRPGIAAWTRLSGAISNLALCYLLIPLYGALGAAIATCLSFFIMFLIMYKWNRKLYPIQLEWSKIGLIAISLIIGFVSSNAANDQLVANIIITIIYPIGLISSGIIKSDIVKEFLSKV